MCRSADPVFASCSVRFKEELAHGGNAGLHKLVDALEPIKARYPDVSYADMYTLAGKVAIESAGGPQISWRKPTPVARTTQHTT